MLENNIGRFGARRGKKKGEKKKGNVLIATVFAITGRRGVQNIMPAVPFAGGLDPPRGRESMCEEKEKKEKTRSWAYLTSPSAYIRRQ